MGGTSKRWLVESWMASNTKKAMTLRQNTRSKGPIHCVIYFMTTQLKPQTTTAKAINMRATGSLRCGLKDIPDYRQTKMNRMVSLCGTGGGRRPHDTPAAVARCFCDRNKKAGGSHCTPAFVQRGCRPTTYRINMPGTAVPELPGSRAWTRPA